MARDARKGAAYASGMRGREKPKVAEAHGSTKVPDNPTEDPVGNQKQEPGKSIGTPGGVSHTDSVYSSGMRGLESGKQKPAQQGRSGGSGDAEYGQTDEGKGGGENHQKPNTQIGNPDGDNTAKRGAMSGVGDEHLRSAAKGAYKLGIPGNNTEQASQGEPIGAEEDETHINVRIPKASLKKRQGAGQAV